MKRWRQYGGLVKEAASDWMEDKAMRLGAALAYYTILSVAPLLVMVVGIAGLVFRRGVVQAGLEQLAAGLVGLAGGDIVVSVLKCAEGLGSRMVATVVCVAVIF